MTPPHRQIGRAARAVRDHSKRVSTARVRAELHYAIVRRVSQERGKILAAELTEDMFVLDDDDLVESAWVRRFIRDHDLKAGETVVVTPMHDGSWLVSDVVTDRTEDAEWQPHYYAEDLLDPLKDVPDAPSLTPSGSGGTLHSDTYYYCVTATDAHGETTESPTRGATVTGTTSKVTLDWPDVTGATGYKVYRGTTRGNLHGLASPSASTYVDDGSDGASGQEPPEHNTTGAKLPIKERHVR